MHQTSEEPDADNEGRRTASLGDLSKLELSTCPNSNRSNTGTLERAQSLEISDQVNAAVGTKVVPKKRKATLADDLEEVDFKEPRLSEPNIENLEALQAGRLKSAYEWGNLEDAIYECKRKDGKASDTDSIGNDTPKKKLSAASIDMMAEVLAAADKFDREVIEIELNDVMSDDVVDTDGDLVVLKPMIAERSSVTCCRNMEIIDETRRFIETEAQNGIFVAEPSSKADDTASNASIVEFDTQSGKGVDGTIETDRVKIFNSGTNMDDPNLTPYPFGSLERPKSEVLKKLIAQQSPVSSSTKSTAKATVTTTTTIISNGTPIMVETITNNDFTESNQISPIFSSDGHGVNSISISSNDSAVANDSLSQPMVSSADSIVTVSTDESQPSSIILIDDENINFTLRTLDDERKEVKLFNYVVDLILNGIQHLSFIKMEMINQFQINHSNFSPCSFFTQHLNGTPTSVALKMPPLPPPRTIKDEVFIIESLSSKKVQEASLSPAISNSSNADTGLVAPPKSFVTEIRLANVAGKEHKMNAKNLSKSLSESHLVAPKIITSATTNNNGDPQTAKLKSTTINSSNKGDDTDKPVIVEEEYIPRNAEIRFTTSTYQSPARQFEKRQSHIDQIRSNFERQHTSEIPIPIRKLSTPSTPPPSSSITRTSPSKIPVLHSQKSSENLLKNNNGPMANRVSVSVTSIKNSSRNPSGK